MCRHGSLCDESLQPSDAAAIDLEKFIFVHKNGIKYMQCDKCSYICRPAAKLFLRHYVVHNGYTHFDETDVREEVEVPSVAPDSEYSSSHCSTKFATSTELQTHRLEHIGRKSAAFFRCEACAQEFCTRAALKNHRRRGCEKHRCHVCYETFVSKSSLQNHLRSVHDSERYEPAEPKKKSQLCSVCPVCGKTLSPAAMSRHMTIHSEKKPFTCDMCGKQFRVKWSLREHIMIEIGMKDYVCEICGRKFVVQGYLNKHMRFHLMDDGQLEGYQCEVCGKKYPEVWRVTEHQRKAHAQKKQAIYECDICGNKYTRKWLVRSHKRIAHKEFFQSYQCEHCGLTFAEKWMIKLHLRTLHDVYATIDENVEEAEMRKETSQVALRRLLEYEKTIKREIAPSGRVAEKSFQCELCKRTFSTKQNMKNHWHAELNLRKHACEYCGKRYNWWMNLKEHLIMNHGEKEYVCGICGKEFPTKSRYQNHVAVHSDRRPYVCECGSSFKLKRYMTKHQRQYCKMMKDGRIAMVE